MRIVPALLLLLASCVAPPADPGTSPGTFGRASSPNVTEQAALLREQARRQVNAATGTPDPGAPAAATEGGTAPNVSIDRNRRLERVDIFTDLMDPASSKQLVAYLLKPDEWMVLGIDMPSPTTRWWRFQRVARTDGTSMPEVDPLKRR